MKFEFDLVTTRNGDTGTSSTFDGCVQSKNHAVFQTVGAIDELSSYIGLVRNVIVENPVRGLKKMMGRSRARKQFLHIQKDLQTGMSLVATNPQFDKKHKPTNELYLTLAQLDDNDIATLEKWQKRILDSNVEIASQFVPPGATTEAAHVDIARATCRRAEREIVQFMGDEGRHDLRYVSMYLNRLSDVLFIFARWLEQNPAYKKPLFKF